MALEPVDDQVVDDPAGLGRQQRVLRIVGLEAVEIVRERRSAAGRGRLAPPPRSRPCARRRRRRRRCARRGAPGSRPCTGRASPSRRTAPCARPSATWRSKSGVAAASASQAMLTLDFVTGPWTCLWRTNRPQSTVPPGRSVARNGARTARWTGPRGGRKDTVSDTGRVGSRLVPNGRFVTDLVFAQEGRHVEAVRLSNSAGARRAGLRRRACAGRGGGAARRSLWRSRSPAPRPSGSRRSWRRRSRSRSGRPRR